MLFDEQREVCFCVFPVCAMPHAHDELVGEDRMELINHHIDCFVVFTCEQHGLLLVHCIGDDIEDDLGFPRTRWSCDDRQRLRECLMHSLLLSRI